MKTSAKKLAKLLRSYLAILADRKSVRAVAHRMILARKKTDKQILAVMNRVAGKVLPASYVSWYRSELGRLGFPMSLRARVTA